MIKEVENKFDANKCDEFLTKLILDERKYDNTIDEKFTVKNYFINLINNEKYILLGYYAEKIIVGYILIKSIDDNSKICLLDGLYVEEKYRKQGIATALIKEALKICKLKGYNCVDINVMYQNQIAKKIYENLGFEEFKISFRKNLNSDNIFS